MCLLSNHIPSFYKRLKRNIFHILEYNFMAGQKKLGLILLEDMPIPASTLLLIKKTAKITAMDKNSFGVSSSPPPFKPVAFMLRQPQSALEPRHRTGSSPGKSPAGWCIQFIIKLHTICTVFHPAPIHKSQPITVVCIYNGILLSH